MKRLFKWFWCWLQWELGGDYQTCQCPHMISPANTMNKYCCVRANGHLGQHKTNLGERW